MKTMTVPKSSSAKPTNSAMRTPIWMPLSGLFTRGRAAWRNWFSWSLWSDEVAVRVGPAVAVELPRVAHLVDHVEVHVAHEQLLVVRVADVADELAARVDEIGLAVEIVVAQILFDADAVDRAHEVAVGQRV